MSPSNDNPFAPSAVANPTSGERREPDLPLGDYSWSQLKKLYYRSCNVICITFLMGLGVAALGAILVSSGARMGDMGPLVPIIVIFNLLAVVGLILRTGWGRILGIIACFMSLLNIPLGTIIGLAGLFAFFGAKELFGEGRLTHGEVKAAFKARKALKR